MKRFLNIRTLCGDVEKTSRKLVSTATLRLKRRLVGRILWLVRQASVKKEKKINLSFSSYKHVCPLTLQL